jgi:DNA repair exonuclease SbcCD ATPase subunit
MKVSQIKLDRVTTHRDTALQLPESGVVLITGDNGSGKSTLIECVPLVVWGKTLRKDSVWADDKGTAAAVIDGVEYTRVAKGKRIKISWPGAPVYESNTDAQAVITDRFGSLDHWRRACVLSSQDAANFTTATDAERKRLIEALTGVDTLEAAYRKALHERTAARAALAVVEGRVELLTERVEGARRRLEAAVPVQHAPPAAPAPVDPARLEALRTALVDAQDDLRDARSTLYDAERVAYDAQSEARRLATERDRIDRDVCPACEQAMPPERRAAAQQAAAEADEKAREAVTTARQQRTTIERDIADIIDEEVDLRQQVMEAEKADALGESVRREQQLREQADASRQAALQELADARHSLTEETAKREESQSEFDHRDAAAGVLSTKGVRAHLLAKTIAAIEASGNAWLGRICGDRITLSLKPYGTKRDGSQKDAVSLEIVGGGQEPRGYGSMSGGERRRIDSALCFALAEVAEAARGERGSTIFCDEIFDALDGEGVKAVADAVATLAQDRCVLVVAHNAAKQLQAVAREHYHVTDGTIARV